MLDYLFNNKRPAFTLIIKAPFNILLNGAFIVFILSRFENFKNYLFIANLIYYPKINI